MLKQGVKGSEFSQLVTNYSSNVYLPRHRHSLNKYTHIHKEQLPNVAMPHFNVTYITYAYANKQAELMYKPMSETLPRSVHNYYSPCVGESDTPDAYVSDVKLQEYLYSLPTD